MATIVNSWNEWDPLKHIIVGRADVTIVQAPEPAVVRDWPEYRFPLGTYGPLPKDMEDAANEQLNNFAALLESRGITVDRPEALDFSQAVSTPDWTQDSMFGVMPPRDVLLTVGNEIAARTRMCFEKSPRRTTSPSRYRATNQRTTATKIDTTRRGTWQSAR